MLKKVLSKGRASRNAYLGLFVVVVIYWVAATTMLMLGGGLPYGTDGNETFSALLGARNLLDHAGGSFLLMDESTADGAKGHPYLYTHGGNLPRFPAAIILAMGVESVFAHVVFSAVVPGTIAIATMFLAVLRLSSTVVAFFTTTFLATNVLLFLQWTTNSWRVWQLLLMSLTLYCAALIFSSRPNRLLMLSSAILTALATYTELSFGLLLATFLIAWNFLLARRRPSSLRSTAYFSLSVISGFFAALLLLASQIIGYLGAEGFLRDLTLTFAARNQEARADASFFLDNYIAYWQNVPDIDAFRSLSSLVLRGALFEALSFGALPLIVLFTGIGFIYIWGPSTYQRLVRSEIWFSGNWALLARVAVMSATTPALFLLSELTSSSTHALNLRSLAITLTLSTLVWAAAAAAFAIMFLRLRRRPGSQIILITATALIQISALSDIIRFTDVNEPSLSAQVTVLAVSSLVLVASVGTFNRTCVSPEVLLTAVTFWLMITIAWLLSSLLLALISSRGYWTYQNSIIPHLDQTSMVLLLSFVLFVVIVFVSQQGSSQSPINLRAQSTPLIQLTLVLAASSLLIFALSPGYVWTGYLTRFVPWVAVILPLLLGLSVGAMWSVVLRLGLVWKRFVIGFAVLGAVVLVWYPQASISPRIFNSSFADLVKVLEEEQPNGLVVNNYAAPFAWSAGTWGYTDWGYTPGGDGKLQAPSFEEQIQGAQYVWLRDWESNPGYGNPEAVVCFSPGSIDPRWDPQRGYCVTDFRKGLNRQANIRKEYRDPLGGWAVFLGENLVVDPEG